MAAGFNHAGGALGSNSVVWYFLVAAVPCLLVFLAEHPRPTTRLASGADRHLNFHETGATSSFTTAHFQNYRLRIQVPLAEADAAATPHA